MAAAMLLLIALPLRPDEYNLRTNGHETPPLLM
jgi:hypothetical protein